MGNEPSAKEKKSKYRLTTVAQVFAFVTVVCYLLDELSKEKVQNFLGFDGSYMAPTQLSIVCAFMK